MNICVVGSGPAGVACARALADRGHDVTILDAGLELEPERQNIIDRLKSHEVEDWDNAAIESIKAGTNSSSRGIPLKLTYGSDFPYREVSRSAPIQSDRVTSFASLASGGLSNVWGAAVLPYRDDDIDDWPVRLNELAPAYQSVFRFMPLAARRDDLESMFPLYADAFHPLRLSNQAQQLLATMTSHKPSLVQEGFLFGSSRLAVRGGEERGCAYCGLCMYGCPYGLIYKSTDSMGTIRYEKNILVQRVAESGSGVTIFAQDLRDGSPRRFEADRVFIGCGVFQTARIMLQSLEAGDHSLTVHDSQYFLLPILGLRAANGVTAEKLHTLSQVFIEVSDSEVSPYPAHLQVYTYNDLYLNAMKSQLGRFFRFLKPICNQILSRLMVIQGYLHSKVSSSASIRLRGDKLIVTQNRNAESEKQVRLLVSKLVRNARRLGFLPLSPLLKIGNVGQGAHSGGTFPMRERPGPFESDRLGRPYGFTRVHLVDASVLPSIPATTITLSVMANAYRIGSSSYDD